MRRTTLLAVLLLAAFAAERVRVRADLPERSDRVVSYTIRAKLDPALKEIRGEMDLVWRNATGKAVDEIYFHLYLNAFKNKDSTFMREGDGEGKAGARFDDEHPGFVRIDRLRGAAEADLLPALAFVQPDDGNEKDETLARLKLPAPVPPQETLSLKIEFTSRLPRVVARTGWSGDPEDPSSLFFMAAQWFPKVAALRQDAGGEPRWNAHQFHRNTEFFADYGTYLVSLTVPDGYVVGATGRASEPVKAAEGVTTTFQQDDVHDFAWTASPQFRTKEFTWTFDSFCDDEPKLGLTLRELLKRTAEHRGLDASQVKPAGTVLVRILYQADHEDLVERIRLAAGASLACYGMWFGAYPYATLTIMDPPSGGAAAGGMEYPTLITIFGDAHAPDYATGLETVTIHEFGHQFFYGLLGSNEFEESWLDEGFTSFTDARVHEVAFGPETAAIRYGPSHWPYFRPFTAPSVYGRLCSLFRVGKLIDKLPHPWKRPASLLPVPDDNAVWDYLREMPALHFDSYVRIPQPFGDRNGYLRSETKDAMVLPGWEFANRTDYRANSYPKPTLLLYTLRGLMGEAAFDKMMYAYAEKHRFGHPRTEDFLAAAKAGETVRFLEAMVETAERFDAAILEANDRKVEVGGAGGPEKHEWTIKVQRRGALELPIEIWANGELLDTWQSRGRETSRTFRFVKEKPLESVRLGPGWLAVVDADLSNNARSVESDAVPAATLAARWTFYVEDLVRSHAGVAR
ncbi:MAG: M1 family metallopeptidase [Planctomycetota bacterium]